jgi:tRNA threonylcarbamoyladenosine biosynthesis protein TsaE
MAEHARCQIDLPSEETTERFARAFARVARPRLVIVLDGDLGAGKTTWVRAVLRAWGWNGPVRSPTYTLHETYDCAGVGRIHHLDLYRLAAPDELADLGLADLWAVPAVWFIEWPSRGVGHLPPIDVIMQWQHAMPGRRVRLSSSSAAGASVCDRWLDILQQQAASPSSPRIEITKLSG